MELLLFFALNFLFSFFLLPVCWSSLRNFLTFEVQEESSKGKKSSNVSVADRDEYLEEEFDDDFDLEEEIDDILPQTTKKPSGPTSSNEPIFSYSSKKKSSPIDDDEDDEDIYKKVDFNGMKLNKLNDQEVSAVKQQMDLDFHKKNVKPSDKDFVYDQREDFDPQCSNDWDEEILDDF